MRSFTEKLKKAKENKKGFTLGGADAFLDLN